MGVVMYAAWIAEFVARVCVGGRRSTLGMCAEATADMVAAFPELRRIPGHVETTWGRRAHWWCVAPDGSVVDPTAEQFEAIFGYDAFKPGDEIRIGRCMNCGDEIWGQPEAPVPTVCSAECGDELHREYNPPRRLARLGLAS